jgi:UDPglucose 6-dehydrogenase
LRDAPAVTIIEQLIGLGARISAYDPQAMPALQRTRPDLEVIYGSSALASLHHCDALVLATEWPEFKAVPLKAAREYMTQPIIIDGRNFFDPNMCRRLGFRYRGTGQG